ncbi:hypothetical protein [Nonomuraea sp. NPDC050202]|uniref:hypothetical protein n=1 Tax=Nonomuraea sp. NPDC050202 TaxID=3155035 RepID=UPI0033E844AC
MHAIEVQTDEATSDELERCNHLCRIPTPTTEGQCPECKRTVYACENCNVCRTCGTFTTDPQDISEDALADEDTSWCGYTCNADTLNAPSPEHCVSCGYVTDFCADCERCKECGR